VTKNCYFCKVSLETVFNTLKITALEHLSSLNDRKKSTVTRLTRSSKIFKTIIQAILDKKGENVISLDLKKYMRQQQISSLSVKQITRHS
jgi:hypothetical protein